jgi:hypothetical protein
MYVLTKAHRYLIQADWKLHPPFFSLDSHPGIYFVPSNFPFDVEYHKLDAKQAQHTGGSTFSLSQLETFSYKRFSSLQLKYNEKVTRSLSTSKSAFDPSCNACKTDCMNAF